ncbi:zinc finger protein ZPR1 [Gadus chalcogrammus]|uniref:zinc finger protein ZPR1 n=1 Tax=Gadus chalcogrammus TaxID=1042646 RepID=UPI0024C4BA39|nr:zinc finger protein ZPR1 [Gadus chalcogrammus]
MSIIHEESVRGGSMFRDINADDEDSQPTEIESMCMNCHEDGMTRLLLSKIPFFKEVIVSSFRCDHCHWSNTEIQSAGRIQDQGIRYTVKIRSKPDLDREVVRSDSAITKIPELDFEVPAYTQKGSLSTIEGLLDRAVVALQQDQDVRRAEFPDLALQIDEFVNKLQKLKHVEEEFTLIIEDPSGNSFVENPVAPQKDEAMTVTHFTRTVDQDAQLGLYPENQLEEEKTENNLEAMRGEVLKFKTNCPECNVPASTNMKLVQIPHFKEVIIMATNCDDCGHRTNEVKSGGATEALGTKITLHVTDASDMSRDLLKSETCGILIPELEFELGMAAVGGKFTTLEGLLTNIKDLIVSKNPFLCGDSSTSDRSEKLQQFGAKIDRIMAGEMDVHIILDDPAGNSYIQNVYAPDPDPELTIEKYTRTYEQNEDLGLNDMKTEGYAE